MKITHIEAVPCSIPCVRPLHLVSGSVAKAYHLLARVHPDARPCVDANRGWSANAASEALRQTSNPAMKFLEEPDDALED